MGSSDYLRFEQLWRQQRGLCFYCACLMTRSKPKKLGKTTATLDHVIPKAAGGGRGANLVLACHSCNQEKADNMPPIGTRLGDFEVSAQGLVWTGEETSLAALDTTPTT